MTVGEYARYINDSENIGCKLTVIKIEGWTRDCLFTDTDLMWVSPSPNLPTPDAAFCYIGTCLAEGTNLSEGRGTAHPFEMIGAPYIDANSLSDHMNSLGLEGVIFRPCHFVPTFSKHSGELCHGVQLHITDKRSFAPFECGLLLIDRIRRTCPDFEIRKPAADGRAFIDLLLGSDDFRADDFDPCTFLAKEKIKLAEYENKIKPYYLY